MTDSNHRALLLFVNNGESQAKVQVQPVQCNS